MDTATVSTVNSYISFGLITEILSRLPVKSLIRFLCVSKRWYDLIHDPYFINIHLKNSIDSDKDRTIIVTEIARSYCYPKTADSYWYQNHLSFPYDHNNPFGKAVEIYPPLVRPRKITNIVGYCNGLVCIHDYETIAIWNPLIKKYKKLPREPIIQKPSSFGNGNYCSIFAFGHDPHKDDYKVVRIVEFVDGRYMEIEVKIYSLKSQAWKKVDEQWKDVEKHLPNKLPVMLSQNPTASLNGDVHWLIVPSGGDPKPVSELHSVLAFDIVNEKMRVYKTPVQPKNDNNMSNTSLARLGVLGGCLCFVVNVQNAKDMYYEVWLMKKYGVESSWTKVYKIEKGAMPEAVWSIEPLIFSGNGKKVLFRGIHFGRVKFIWYDVEKKRGKSVKIQNLPAMFASSVTSIGSLLLLDGDNDVIGPRQNKRTRSERRR